MSSASAVVSEADPPGRADKLLPSGGQGDGRSSPGEQSCLIANSQAMKHVLEKVRQFAACDIPVLITGEAGTGKKLAARTIHAASRRRIAPFASFHCSSNPASAMDLELFGRERDPSRGTEGRRGLLEKTTGGTVLIEEIGSLSPTSQALLLRLLDTSEVIRLGGREPMKADVRLITTVTLAKPELVAAPALRPDLYYRLSALRLHLPPLRERAEDIEELATHLLQRIASRLGRDVRGFSPQALAALCGRPWPGNARELIGVIQGAVVLTHATNIERGDLHLEEPAPPAPAFAPAPVRPAPGSAAELNLLLETLRRVRFSVTRAARGLKVSRVTLYRMLKRNGLELRQDAVLRRQTDDDQYQA